MLKLTCNSKTKFGKIHKNTFGLMYGRPEDGGTCPGATTGEGGCLYIRQGLKRETCYMAKITQIYKAVGNVLLENTEKLKGASQEEMERVLEETIQEFIRKDKSENRFFRLHYSGDFFSETYAKAWAKVITKYPQVRFWVYTRSFAYVDTLLGLPNLSLFLSCDPVNWEAAKTIFEKHKEKHNNLGLAWLGPNEPNKDYRFVTCPETSGKVKNTDERGACAKCRLCVDNYKIRIKNIKFNLH